jgi:PqqD family protein of HPr-rel-A system
MSDAVPSSDAVAWRIAPTVRWRHWDGEIAAYDDATGDTHHLADLAAWVFMRLAETPRDIATLRDAAERSIALPDGTDLAAAVIETVALLRARRLVEASGT